MSGMGNHKATPGASPYVWEEVGILTLLLSPAEIIPVAYKEKGQRGVRVAVGQHQELLLPGVVALGWAGDGAWQ